MNGPEHDPVDRSPVVLWRKPMTITNEGVMPPIDGETSPRPQRQLSLEPDASEPPNPDKLTPPASPNQSGQRTSFPLAHPAASKIDVLAGSGSPYYARVHWKPQPSPASPRSPARNIEHSESSYDGDPHSSPTLWRYREPSNGGFFRPLGSPPSTEDQHSPQLLSGPSIASEFVPQANRVLRSRPTPVSPPPINEHLIDATNVSRPHAPHITLQYYGQPAQPSQPASPTLAPPTPPPVPPVESAPDPNVTVRILRRIPNAGAHTKPVMSHSPRIPRDDDSVQYVSSDEEQDGYPPDSDDISCYPPNNNEVPYYPPNNEVPNLVTQPIQFLPYGGQPMYVFSNADNNEQAQIEDSNEELSDYNGEYQRRKSFIPKFGSFYDWLAFILAALSMMLAFSINLVNGLGENTSKLGLLYHIALSIGLALIPLAFTYLPCCPRKQPLPIPDAVDLEISQCRRILKTVVLPICNSFLLPGALVLLHFVFLSLGDDNLNVYTIACGALSIFVLIVATFWPIDRPNWKEALAGIAMTTASVFLQLNYDLPVTASADDWKMLFTLFICLCMISVYILGFRYTIFVGGIRYAVFSHGVVGLAGSAVAAVVLFGIEPLLRWVSEIEEHGFNIIWQNVLSVIFGSLFYWCLVGLAYLTDTVTLGLFFHAGTILVNSRFSAMLKVGLVSWQWTLAVGIMTGGLALCMSLFVARVAPNIAKKRAQSVIDRKNKANEPHHDSDSASSNAPLEIELSDLQPNVQYTITVPAK